MNETITKKINEAAEAIRFYISEGIERERAIEMMRGASTLGPKSWAMVMELVDDPRKFIVSL